MSGRGSRIHKDVQFAVIPEWILYHEEISAQAIRLYGVLARFSDGNRWPSRRDLAERIRVSSEKTVDRAMKELVDAGAVSVVARWTEDGDRTSNAYDVHVTAPGTPARPDVHGADVETQSSTSPGVGSQKSPPPDTGVPTRGDRKVPTGGDKNVAVERATLREREPTVPSCRELALADQPESSNEPKSREVALRPGERDDVERLCTHLADRVEANGSKRPPVTQRWRDAARLLLDRDRRTEQQVHTAIDWCQDDEFWRSNILSMPKLREQYDRLRLAAQRANSGLPRRRNDDIDWDAAAARAAELTAMQAQPLRSLP